MDNNILLDALLDNNTPNLEKLDTSQFLTELPHLLVRCNLPAPIIALIQDHVDAMYDERFKDGYRLGYADGYLRVEPEW